MSGGNDGIATIKSLQSTTGGVHKQFWTAFAIFLQQLRHNANSLKSLPTTSRNSCDRLIKILEEALKAQGCQNGHWLSDVRNGVNYRLEFGAWHPYANNKDDANQLIAMLKRAFHDEPQSALLELENPPLQAFVGVCTFLIGWLRVSLAGFYDQAVKTRKRELTDGPIALL